MGRLAKQAQAAKAADAAAKAAEGPPPPPELDLTTKWLLTSGVVSIGLIGVALMAPYADKVAYRSDGHRILSAVVVFWVILLFRFARKMIWHPNSVAAQTLAPAAPALPTAEATPAKGDTPAASKAGAAEDGDSDNEDGGGATKARQRPRRA